MEKISGIVGNSARVGSGDAKSAPPVRPGVPTFGRPIGDSPHFERSPLSTAQKVGIIHSDLAEQKKLRAEAKIAADMAPHFFVKPEEGLKAKVMPAISPSESQVLGVEEDDVADEPTVRATSARVEALQREEDVDLKAASRFTPRGSFIDVRA